MLCFDMLPCDGFGLEDHISSNELALSFDMLPFNSFEELSTNNYKQCHILTYIPLWDDLTSKEIIRNAPIILTISIVMCFNLLAYGKNPLFRPPPQKKILLSMWHVKFLISGSLNYIISNPSILYKACHSPCHTKHERKLSNHSTPKGDFTPFIFLRVVKG